MSKDSGSLYNNKNKKMAVREIWKRRRWAREIIEKLKDGPAYLRDFTVKGIPERSAIRTLKDLQTTRIIYRKDSKYLLPGYEHGSPNIGQEALIRLKYLQDYLSWGWRFGKKVNQGQAIVEYRPPLPWQREEILRGGGAKKMKSSAKKGEEFEVEVRKIIEGVIDKAKADFRAEVASHSRLMGFSAEWHPDLVLTASSLLHPLERSLELAIVECKYVDQTASEGTYWSQMSRAYMILNDLRHVYREDLGFFLAVSRHSKGKKRDYSAIFKNIGVKLVDINIPEERSKFENDIKRLLKETTFEEQERKLSIIWKQYGS